jgi:hypothetical protein
MDFQLFNLIRNPVDAIWQRKEWVLLILKKFLRDKFFFARNP